MPILYTISNVFIKEANQFQTLLGVTGFGKNFTMANVIAALNKPTLVIAHNSSEFDVSDEITYI